MTPPSNNKRILGMGNPLLDIAATTTAEFLKKYDLKDNDATLAVAGKHDNLTKHMTENFKVQYVPGGAAQNTIRIAQWFLEPHSTSFIGCVGKDEYADRMRTIAARAGVDVNYMVDESAATGTCAVLLTGMNRSMVANLSAANNYKISHIENPENWKIVQEADIVYISGFFLTVSPDTMLKVGKHTSTHDSKTFVMNLSAPFLPQFFKDHMESVLPYCDIIISNETEARAFAENFNYQTDNIGQIALKLCMHEKFDTKRQRMVIFTQGKDKTVLAYEGKVTEYAVGEVAANDIVDTNGCGDAFVGGFLASLIKDYPIDKCIECGHYAAHEVLKQSGCMINGEPDPQYL